MVAGEMRVIDLDVAASAEAADGDRCFLQGKGKTCVALSSLYKGGPDVRRATHEVEFSGSVGLLLGDVREWQLQPKSPHSEREERVAADLPAVDPHEGAV